MTAHDAHNTHAVALLLERHLGECEQRNKQASEWMATAAAQRERMEDKLDRLGAALEELRRARERERATVKTAVAIFGGLATAAGAIGGALMKRFSS